MRSLTGKLGKLKPSNKIDIKIIHYIKIYI